jgi:histone deacetylase 8
VLVILALKRPISIPPYASALAYPIDKPRIMYLDLDLHFSDAVSEAFHTTNSSSPAQVLVSDGYVRFKFSFYCHVLQTFSMHYAAPGFFPTSPLSNLSSVSNSTFDPFTLSLPLRQGASNSTFARMWPIIERARDIFEPHFIVVQCGVDGLAGDPCATWNWSLGGSDGSLGWCIGRIIKEWSGKKLLLGGGRLEFPFFLSDADFDVRRVQLA